MLIQLDSTISKSAEAPHEGGFCQGCFKRQNKIDRLEEELKRLRAEVSAFKKRGQSYSENAHTPSSQIALKPNVKSEKKKPGLKAGHEGYKRKEINYEEADCIRRVARPKKCQYCGKRLQIHDVKKRWVWEQTEHRIEKTIYEVERGYCGHCRQDQKRTIPALPKGILGNQLLAEAAVMHYHDQITLGKLADFYDQKVTDSVLIQNFHRLHKIFEPSFAHLVSDYQNTQVRHADETGWRTHGKNGFAWIFCSRHTALFHFATNRSAQNVRQILGEKSLDGCLVIDRFSSYNCAPCDIQYCYAHLLRDVEQIRKNNPLNEEIQFFVSQMSQMLSEAMRLQNLDIDDLCFYENARVAKHDMQSIVLQEFNHPEIKKFQKIFVKNEDRLYHWSDNREIPAHNNLAERYLRPTVIARKVSLGSKSEQGRKTRSVLMSLLTTAHLRLGRSRAELLRWFKSVLDDIAATGHFSLDLIPRIPDS